MPERKARFPLDRRQFLGCVGCLSCLAGGSLLGKPAHAAQDGGAPASAPTTHKFQDETQFTFEHSLKFTYAESLLPHLKAVGEEIGRKRLLKIIQNAAEKRAFDSNKQRAQGLAEANLKSFTEWAYNPNRFWQHVLTFTIVEDSPTAFEFKFTECLFAKTFREAGGADIGYAVLCHPDFAAARGFSPKLRLARTKTLMQGDDCCNHRWLWAG